MLGRDQTTIVVETSTYSIVLEVVGSDTVADIKTMIRNQTGIPSDEQQLTDGEGIELQDRQNLCYYLIYKDLTLLLRKFEFLS